MERKNATIGEETKKGMKKLWTEPTTSQPESADGQTRDRSNDTDDLDHPDLEDPAQAWIMLVEACHLKDKKQQHEQIKICLAMARTSNWTQQILDQLDEDFYNSDDEATTGWEEEVLGHSYRENSQWDQ